MQTIDELVAAIEVPALARVLVPDLAARPAAFHELTDDEFDEMWERPMRDVIRRMIDARAKGANRIVVVTPTTGMSGGDQYAATAATAEAVRVLVKSAARQWGSDGITVNAVAVAPRLFGIDEAVAGAQSIAPPALAEGGDPAAVITFLCSAAAGGVTGTTITADGGVWMSP
jgi:3-oxoacyl-[acyl-carrier protein] reductase